MAISETALMPRAPAASTNDLAAKLRAAARAIAGEEAFWASLPRELLGCAQGLLAAGRKELEEVGRQLEVLSRTHEVVSRYTEELRDTELALRKATSRDPLVDDFDAKLLARVDALEAYEDAARALQRAQKRGKDTKDCEVEADAASAAARSADGALRGATAALARVLHTFPEVAAKFRNGLPMDLLDLWVPERTLDVFSGRELLPVSSQHRVYRVVDEVGKAFVVKEYQMTPTMLGVCYREAALPHNAMLHYSILHNNRHNNVNDNNVNNTNNNNNDHDNNNNNNDNNDDNSNNNNNNNNDDNINSNNNDNNNNYYTLYYSIIHYAIICHSLLPRGHAAAAHAPPAYHRAHGHLRGPRHRRAVPADALLRAGAAGHLLLLLSLIYIYIYIYIYTAGGNYSA